MWCCTDEIHFLINIKSLSLGGYKLYALSIGGSLIISWLLQVSSLALAFATSCLSLVSIPNSQFNVSTHILSFCKQFRHYHSVTYFFSFEDLEHLESLNSELLLEWLLLRLLLFVGECLDDLVFSCGLLRQQSVFPMRLQTRLSRSSNQVSLVICFIIQQCIVLFMRAQ